MPEDNNRSNRYRTLISTPSTSDDQELWYRIMNYGSEIVYNKHVNGLWKDVFLDEFLDDKPKKKRKSHLPDWF